MVGLLEAGLVDKPDFLVNGAAGGCDPNSKIFEYMSEKWDIPALYLDVPYTHDQKAIDYYTQEYRGVVEQLQELSGNKLDQDRLREEKVGYFYDVITNGFGAMQGYAEQIPPRDRWLIAAYVRALQLSQNATVNDVPAAERGRLDAPAAGAGEARH